MRNCQTRLPAPPPAKQAIRRKQHDHEKHATDHEIEALAVNQINRKVLQHNKHNRADKRANRVAHATKYRDDENIDKPTCAHRTRRNQAVVPNQQHTTASGNETCKRISCHTMRGDIEAKRIHAARVVANALQGDAKGRANQILDRKVGQERHRQTEVEKWHRVTPIQATDHGGVDLLQTLKTAKDAIVLQSKVVKARAERERNHDRVNAFGAHRKPADEGADQGGDKQCHRHHQPPRPVQTDFCSAARAKNGHHVAGYASHCHLRQRDHAAVAAEKGERERNHA